MESHLSAERYAKPIIYILYLTADYAKAAWVLGIRITQKAFTFINFIPVCIVTFVAMGIIVVEVLYWM